MILRKPDRRRAWIPRRVLMLAALLSLAPALFAGCAYFNTFYYARQHWAEAERARLESEEKPGAAAPVIEPKDPALPETEPVPKRALELYEKCMKKCAKVLTEYENSRWVDDALLLMGKCAVIRGEYATGLRKFEELIEFYPKSDLVPEARLQIGIAHLAEGSRALAITSLQAVLDNPPNKEIAAEARYQIGRAYLANGDSAAAVEALGAFIMSDDGEYRSWAAANRTLAAIDLARGEPTRAREAYERLEPSPRSDWPAYRETRLAIARCLREERRPEEAEWVLEELLTRMTDVRDSALVDYEMALILQEERGDEAAVQRFAEVAFRYPRTESAAKALYQRAVILYEQEGDLFRARNAFDSVLVHSPQIPEATLAKQQGTKLARRLALDEQLAAHLQRIAARGYEPAPEPQPGSEPEAGAPEGAGEPSQQSAAAARADSIRAESAGLDSALTASPPPSLLAPEPERGQGEELSAPDTLRSVVSAPDSIAQAISPDLPQPASLAAGSSAPAPVPPASLRDALAPPRAAAAIDPRQDPGASDPRQDPAASAAFDTPPSALNAAATGGEPTASTSEYLSSLSPDSLQVLFAYADSAGRESLAEIYVQIGETELLELGRVDRAMAAYETAALSFAGTSHEPRALLAIAWIDAHQLDRRAEADSIYRIILGEHGETRFARGAALALGMEVPMSEEEMLEDPSLSYDEEKVRAAERAAARAASTPLPEQVENVARRGGEIPTPPGLESGADQNQFFSGDDSLRAAMQDSIDAANPMAMLAPRPVRLATPDYPPELEEAGIVGTVRVEVVVDISGHVMMAQVLSSDNEALNDHAVQAAENSTFTPPRGAEDRATVTFRFPPPRPGQTQPGQNQQQGDEQQQQNEQGDVPPEP